MKRFACQDIIPGCAHVFTGADDQSVLDQVIAHAAVDHGLVKPPLALVELVVATTHTFTPKRTRGHLRLVGTDQAEQSDVIAEGSSRSRQDGAVTGTAPVLPDFPAFPERVTQAIPFQRRGESRRNLDLAGDDRWTSSTPTAASAAHWPQFAHSTYRHECVFYSGADEFLEQVIPFIVDGLALDQPVMVAVAEPRLTAVRAALGDDAARVVLLDMAVLGANPASIIPAWRDFIAGTDGRAIRGVGEPIWSGRRTTEIVEGQLHEALLNLAVDPDTPLWLMCPYDVTALDQGIIDEARRSHPLVGGSTHRSDDTSAADHTTHAMALFAAHLPEPVQPTNTMTITGDGDVATRVFDAAASAGLPACRSAKLAAAVDEVANAGTRNSGAAVDIRLWQDHASFVCEVRDHGTIEDLLVGRGSALSTQSRDRGIRLANELCDLVQVRSNSAGTAVRIHTWL